MVYSNGECPQCLLGGNQVDLQLNTFDLWECKKCNLQLAANTVNAVVIRKRGKGKFRSQIELGSQNIISAVLSGADKKLPVISDNNFFKSEGELRNYLENEVLPAQILELVEKLNINNTFNHYYFKFGEKNIFFEKYYHTSNGFESNAIVPLAIYFGKWKVEDFDNPETGAYKEFAKSDLLSKKQIDTFMSCGKAEIEKSIFWIFYKDKVYALQPFQEVQNGPTGDIDKAFSFPKTINSKIILTIDKDKLPENFVTLNANQRYNRRTIARLDRKEELVADFLIKERLGQKLRIQESELLEFLSPIQFETLIFLIFHHSNIFVSTYRGGTLEAIDLKIKVSKKSNLKEFGSSGWKYIQIKMFDYSSKKPRLKLEENCYLIHLGGTDVANHILGKNWIMKKVQSIQAIKEWLTMSLDWYEIEK